MSLHQSSEQVRNHFSAATVYRWGFFDLDRNTQTIWQQQSESAAELRDSRSLIRFRGSLSSLLQMNYPQRAELLSCLEFMIADVDSLMTAISEPPTIRQNQQRLAVDLAECFQVVKTIAVGAASASVRCALSELNVLGFAEHSTDSAQLCQSLIRTTSPVRIETHPILARSAINLPPEWQLPKEAHTPNKNPSQPHS